MSRCTGHCCRSFPVCGTTPEEWADPKWYGTKQDGAYISDMLIHLGHNGKQDYYTCRHFNPDTGDCKQYESRPAMCRDYPYGSECEHKECTEDSKPDVPMSRFNLKSLFLRK